MDSVAAVISMLDCVEGLPTQPPSLYLDIEGMYLSRYGSISIVQLFVEPENHIFLIDVHFLQGQAFDTTNTSGTTLRSVLESDLIPKAFFDVRNDADALFAHFQVSMRGIHDVQLLEIATRSSSKERVNGLATCIQRDANLSADAMKACKATKEAGLLLFAPEHGGSYEVFNTRPMRQEIIDYCTQDVVYLPALWTTYSRKLSTQWATRVQEATCQRLLNSQAESYDPKGKDKVLSPWGNGAQKGQPRRAKYIENTTSKLQEKKYKNPAGIAAAKEVQGTTENQHTMRLGHRPQEEYTVTEGQKETTELKVAEEALDTPKDFEPPTLAMMDLAIKNSPAFNNTAMMGVFATPDTTKWNCMVCDRMMQQDQAQSHVAGKAHVARLRENQGAMSKQLGLTQTTTASGIQLKKAATAATHSKKKNKRPKNQAQQHMARHAGGKASTYRKLSTEDALGQVGALYPPEHGFVGFSGSTTPQSYWQEDGLYMGDFNYGICDSDCGWCGHCMDGLDI